MKFSVGQTVKVSLPGCPLDGEIHEITAVQPKELMKYVIQKDSAYYSFSERELTEATRVLEEIVINVADRGSFA